MIACLIVLPTCDDLIFSLTCLFCPPPTFLPPFLHLPTFPPFSAPPPYHTHCTPFSAKYIQYNIARQMATWSSIAFYLAFTINLLVALFYPFDQGSKSLGELLVALAYVIEHHSVSFAVMSPHCGLIDFCSCTQCRRQFVL